MVDVRHAGALRLLGDDLACLALGAHEQDGAAVLRELTHVLHRVVVHRQRLLEVDDVDLVALAEDVVGHLRIPVPRLVTEMNAGLQHLTHGYGHASLHSGLCLHRRLAFPVFEPDTLKRRCAKWTARIAACRPRFRIRP
jgi:hypothetical protein